MQTYIAILRGINVSGQKKIPMVELRGILTQQGLLDVQTYIQSGNIVFKAPKEAYGDLNRIIGKAIQEHFGYQVPVIVLKTNELRQAVDQNPLVDQDTSYLHITFLADEPSKELVATLPPSPNPCELYDIEGKVIYVYCPDGYGRTKLNNMFFERKLKVTATTRNWRTCMKLLQLAHNL